MPKPKRDPKYGDTLFIPDGFGSWVNGVCNTTDASAPDLLIGVAEGAHKSGAQIVSVPRKKYMREWAFPEDMPAQGLN